MPRKGEIKTLPGDPSDPDGLLAWRRRYVEHLRVKGYTEQTVTAVHNQLGLFIAWAFDRGITQPREVSRPILERYQRHLFYYRKHNGKPLTFSSQRDRLQKVQGLFKWLCRQNALLSNPASELELPRVERRLPRTVLTERQIEKVMAIADATEVLGLRDRAMMEVLYSTGIRRAELARLQLFDVDAERGTVSIRQGKGRRDRTVPIGERALSWLGRYLSEARPELVVPPDPVVIFLSELGEPIRPERLTHIMSDYIARARLGKSGACHVFRHTMATLMLEGGADIRLIQEILGHVMTSTTQLYTRVTIRHLKAVHAATHPGAKLERRAAKAAPEKAGQNAEAELLAALESEASEETDVHHNDGGDGRREGDPLCLK